MKSWLRSMALLFGWAPRRPSEEEITPEAKTLREQQSGKKDLETVTFFKEAHAKQKRMPQKWRRRRWAVLLSVNFLFMLSYWLTSRADVQILEGALTGSRFLGFHMADLNASLQVMLASKLVKVNLIIGFVTIGTMWWLLGGRTFCSWVCPYHLLAEWAEILHVKLARKGWVKNHPLDRRVRVVFWLLFAALAFGTGYTVYETISPTGILSRALIYGPGLALAWVALLLLFEVVYTRRAWCRYVCPIGLTYGVVGSTSPLRVTYHLDKCFHEGACRNVCLVPHVLDTVLKGHARDTHVPIGADCTRCGRCVDTCPRGALTYEFKGIGNKS